MELVGRLVLGIYGLWRWMHEIFSPRLLGLSLRRKPKLFLASCHLVPEIINLVSSTQVNCNKRAKGRNEETFDCFENSMISSIRGWIFIDNVVPG